MFSRYTILNRLSKDYYGLKKVKRSHIDYMISIRRRRRFQDFLDHMFGWYYRPKIRQRKLKIFDNISEKYYAINLFNISLLCFRKEEYTKKKNIFKTNSIFQDAYRRDFTINSIYLDLYNETIFAYYDKHS